MIEAHKLAKRYGRVEALQDVSFKIRKGTITAMLGENGAGKTTTLKIALGFLRPDAGSVAIAPGRVGYVPDRPAFPAGLDGWTILGLCRNRERAGGEGNGRSFAAAVLGASRSLLFDPGLLRRAPGAYSAGNAKKFAFLQNLVLAPDLLVADEPYAALDPPAVKCVRDIFCGLRDAGKTVLISSHMLAEMERIADGFVVLRRGRTIVHAGLREWRLLRASRTGPDLESVFLLLSGP
ncbi:MAG TPA: ATP-binding cassette domain-containing protein [Candidatus Aminicenantes bacterium]|nr:ATP-binding cassette domain-containing protein [Candidatus Aminicenantes bacterium]HRY64426.1 ATP-binding cassette domain-containing protein [Candidatus Aminicenantes bacterium]HRZ71339.1 ATP-binding cassette domain-containing protein [Candidatus Aminicenantes bacterium]